MDYINEDLHIEIYNIDKLFDEQYYIEIDTYSDDDVRVLLWYKSLGTVMQIRWESKLEVVSKGKINLFDNSHIIIDESMLMTSVYCYNRSYVRNYSNNCTIHLYDGASAFMLGGTAYKYGTGICKVYKYNSDVKMIDWSE